MCVHAKQCVSKSIKTTNVYNRKPKKMIKKLKIGESGHSRHQFLTQKPFVTYFDTQKQWATTFASNQLIWIMSAFENKSICSVDVSHNLKHNFVK